MESFSKCALGPHTRPWFSKFLIPSSLDSILEMSENLVAPSASAKSTCLPLATKAPRLTAPPFPRFLAEI